MRLVLFTLGVLAGTSVFGTCAEAQNYPWCAVYNEDVRTEYERLAQDH